MLEAVLVQTVPLDQRVDGLLRETPLIAALLAAAEEDISPAPMHKHRPTLLVFQEVEAQMRLVLRRWGHPPVLQLTRIKVGLVA